MQVVRRLRSLIATSVSAALDLHSWFAVCRSPGSTGSLASNCWGAVRVHHRCRLLLSPDAACEGVGSIMRLQWDSRRSTGEVAGRVTDSIALSAAGVRCVGAARDEALVAAVVATMRGASRYRPRRLNVQSAHVADLTDKSGAAAGGDFALGIPSAFHGIATAFGRRAALKERGQLRSAAVMPSELAAQLAKATCSLKDASGRIRQLPLNVLHLHARQRGAAGSVEKSHQKEALQKKALLQDPLQALWHAERAKLLKADDPDSDGDEQDPGRIPAQKPIDETKTKRRRRL